LHQQQQLRLFEVTRQLQWQLLRQWQQRIASYSSFITNEVARHGSQRVTLFATFCIWQQCIRAPHVISLHLHQRCFVCVQLQDIVVGPGG
jgi:hypothetical protein